MAAKTGTYSLINSTTLGSAQSSVTFSSIPATFTDLVLVLSLTNNSGVTAPAVYVRVNGDTGSNYSTTMVYGTGSAAGSGRGSNNTYALINWLGGGSNSIIVNGIVNFLDYSNTTTFKTLIHRYNNSSAEVDAGVSLWRSTSAINSITVLDTTTRDFVSGSTFKLYGIEAGNS
jgi:hypothetical protein